MKEREREVLLFAGKLFEDYEGLDWKRKINDEIR